VSPGIPPAIEVSEAATPTAEPAPLPEPPAAAVAAEPPLPKPPAPAAHASPDFATAPDEPPAAASETFPDAAAERATVPPAPPVATGDVPAMEPVATPAAVQSASLPSETSSAAGMDDPAIQPARYDVAALGNPKPDYPWLSRQRGEEGRVVLRVEVTATGEVARIEVAESSGHRRLDEAALETVAAWRFDPARVGDQPIATTVNVPVTFQLQN
jgi:protein TonB